jgi:hypothetical protein
MGTVVVDKPTSGGGDFEGLMGKRLWTEPRSYQLAYATGA